MIFVKISIIKIFFFSGYKSIYNQIFIYNKYMELYRDEKKKKKPKLVWLVVKFIIVSKFKYQPFIYVYVLFSGMIRQ